MNRLYLWKESLKRESVALQLPHLGALSLNSLSNIQWENDGILRLGQFKESLRKNYLQRWKQPIGKPQRIVQSPRDGIMDLLRF